MQPTDQCVRRPQCCQRFNPLSIFTQLDAGPEDFLAVGNLSKGGAFAAGERQSPDWRSRVSIQCKLVSPGALAGSLLDDAQREYRRGSFALIQ
jgi:hypothetical protein